MLSSSIPVIKAFLAKHPIQNWDEIARFTINMLIAVVAHNHATNDVKWETKTDCSELCLGSLDYEELGLFELFCHIKYGLTSRSWGLVVRLNYPYNPLWGCRDR